MNCTHVLMSKWGKGFGVVAPLLGDDHVLNIPNCLVGIGFYSLMGLLFLCGGKNR
jgi:vitamin-K-epoxide reductase (warfarin-sensitive)